MPEFRSDNLVCFIGESIPWHHLLTGPLAHEIESLASGFPCVVLVDDARQAVTASAVAFDRQLDIALVGRERMSDGVRDLLSSMGYHIVDLNSPTSCPSQVGGTAIPGRISLLTSGSTGTPKLVSHTWETLFTAGQGNSVVPRRWVVPFQLGSYAWFQIVTQGMFQPEQTLLFPRGTTPPDVIREAAEWQADSISATPTFWRIAMLQTSRETLTSVPLKYISIGGEMVDQPLLDQLASLYPNAQITHIFASSEAGTCVVVKDGTAGFPVTLLGRRDPDLPQLRISNGRLMVNSPFAAFSDKGATSDWVDTGDLVEIRGDRVYFCGRAGRALINVGGNKAYPADIEAVILSHSDIQWCRVRAVKARIVGELVEADYVCRSNVREPTQTELVAHCGRHLPEYAIPRLWNQLDSIPVKSSLKSELE